MRSGKLLILCSAVLAALPAAVFAQQAVFLVRHAEKVDESTDPPLSRAGRARAKSLAGLLETAGITAIYATQYQRAIKTAEPLSHALKIDVKIVDQRDPGLLVSRLRSQHAQDVILIVGHSNTVPALLKALGYRPETTIAPEDYGNLFIVVPKADGPPMVLRLRF